MDSGNLNIPHCMLYILNVMRRATLVPSLLCRNYSVVRANTVVVDYYSRHVRSPISDLLWCIHNGMNASLQDKEY